MCLCFWAQCSKCELRYVLERMLGITSSGLASKPPAGYAALPSQQPEMVSAPSSAAAAASLATGR